MQTALRGYEQTRTRTASTFRDYGQARAAARAIKWEGLLGLAGHLEQFAAKLEARGGKVCWAANAEEARDYILKICQRRQARLIVKSKCMTTEEIHLNEALAAKGYETVETDLGEYIVQLREEAPFHFVFPAMHLKRDEISRIFEAKLGTPPSDSPEELTMIARRALRLKYLQADIGISGAVITPHLRGLRSWRHLSYASSLCGACTETCPVGIDLHHLLLRNRRQAMAAALEQCAVGITGCEALIAQTGGVLVTARSGGGRGLSVLVPHHIVLARSEQLVPDLSAAFALLESRYGSSLPSSISFITGPSRTGDIERILVLGAHGPARLTIVLLNGTWASG